ncbi:hypothetical protein MSSIT_2890 [Methanosarcina siciliae T4/M]|uniref:Uncharacterized protein n=3 Tax=Methanosarcina siciliae TaxID=38027 RepID=A0A0E3PFX1_9EURY|nr:hypothetical protein MSSIT_2890 [Methanosarcina siciliae T4/M]AKB33545.1 hypothetical protein MSSIH_2855 [Methanosarcina siciliae HI350]
MRINLINSLNHFGNKIVQIIPQVYRDDYNTINTLYKWTLIGIIIRLIFMPFAAHGDLISTYHRSYLILNGPTSVTLYTLTQIIQSLFLSVYQYFIPLNELLMYQGSTSCSTSHWLDTFVQNRTVFRTLFLFKIPYLLFDFASGITLLHILNEKSKGILAYKFWMVNPIIIFSVYIFGRYETIPIFFVLLSLYFAEREKPYLSVFMLSIAITERAYPLFFLPFYVLGMGKNFYEKIKLSFTGIFLFLLQSVIFKIYSILTNIPSENIVESHFSDYLLSMNFEIGYGQTIYIFIAMYAFLGIYFLGIQHKNFEKIWEFSLATLLVLYATSFFHPHYFSWFTPFIAIAITKYQRFLGIHFIQVFCFIFYTFYWREAMAGWLFASISPQYIVHLISPFDLINKLYPAVKVVNIFRSILTGSLIYMFFEILAHKSEGDNE